MTAGNLTLGNDDDPADRAAESRREHAGERTGFWLDQVAYGYKKSRQAGATTNTRGIFTTSDRKMVEEGSPKNTAAPLAQKAGTRQNFNDVDRQV